MRVMRVVIGFIFSHHTSQHSISGFDCAVKDGFAPFVDSTFVPSCPTSYVLSYVLRLARLRAHTISLITVKVNNNN